MTTEKNYRLSKTSLYDFRDSKRAQRFRDKNELRRMIFTAFLITTGLFLKPLLKHLPFVIRYAILHLSTQTYTQGYKLAWLQTIVDFRNHLKGLLTVIEPSLKIREIPVLNEIKLKLQWITSTVNTSLVWTSVWNSRFCLSCGKSLIIFHWH